MPSDSVQGEKGEQLTPLTDKPLAPVPAHHVSALPGGELAGPGRGGASGDEPQSAALAASSQAAVAWKVGLARFMLAPVAGAGVLALALRYDPGVDVLAVGSALAAFVAGALLAGLAVRWKEPPPALVRLWPIAGALAGGSVLAALGLIAGTLDVSAFAALLASVAATAATAATAVSSAPSPPSSTWRSARTVRTAIMGSSHSASSLERELRLTGRRKKYVLAGRVVPPGEDLGQAEAGGVTALGSLDRLGEVISEHKIDLLLMTSEVPRLAVFDQLARASGERSVRLWELSGFYEAVFGHVPVTEINGAWFQYILHPNFRATPPVAKRVLDVSVALAVGLFALPVLLCLGLLIRRDRGPALLRQVRVGQGGLPFTLFKLRTLRMGAPNTQFVSEHDPRVTPTGAFLRRTHIDELPQVLNVLRGDMSLVGPRPEQPQFVTQLEETIPFYDRRHTIKPGITGWAQLRCGYANSDVGTVWKLCHDLYYLKHRSFKLDLVILGKTARTLVYDRQYGVESKISPRLLRSDGARDLERA